MSPEDPEVKDSYRELNGSTTTTNLGKMTNNDEIVVNAEMDKSQQTRKQRERRTQPLEHFIEPLSPASSSSASQANTATDITFEPTIDMMVNDFDDEQTLNEEEALAATEQQDAQDEIATLKEESEMPLEMLLAKYAVHPQAAAVPAPPPARKRPKKTSKKVKSKRNETITESEAKTSTNINGDVTNSTSDNIAQPLETQENTDVIVIESGDEDQTEIEPRISAEEDIDVNEPDDEINGIAVTPEINVNAAADDCNAKRLGKIKQRRSHLLDLYPERAFGSTDEGKDIALDMLYGDEEEEDDDDEAEDDEIDNDYVTKTIMVGAAYQAVIPDGLSQYGDVLPYENEDKLIWEPSQVGEQEVEQYLIKARDIKPTLADDEPIALETTNKEQTSSANEQQAKLDKDSSAGNPDDINLQNTGTESKNSGDADLNGVIKDNEQALHLLVQCGYDFKEALRRKRLNALPLTGSMSIWSEEECHKFEEGFQKFGKDFLKIRQNQVRTRSMRELVQFYYLWKKSERRDHEFANSDTVDHMDMFLNEGGDYGSNASAASNCAAGVGMPSIASPSFNTRKSTASTQKNFSIMTGNNVCSNASSTSSQNNTTTAKFNNRRRATGVSNNVAANVGLAGTASLLTVNASDNQINVATATSCATK